MSSLLKAVSSATNLDLVLTVVRDDKERGTRVQATLTRFESNSEGGARVLKKVSAYGENLDLDKAQDKAIEKAAGLLGLEA